MVGLESPTWSARQRPGDDDRLPEGTAGRKLLERGTSRIGVVERHGVSPPRLDSVRADTVVIWILEAEEYKDSGNGHARVQRGRKYI